MAKYGKKVILTSNDISSQKSDKPLSTSIFGLGDSITPPDKLAVPQEDLLVFFRQLAVILKSGVPLAQGLSLLAENISNKKFAYCIEDISNDLTTFGEQMSQSLTSTVLSELNQQLTKIEELLTAAQSEYSLSLQDVTTAIPDGSALQDLRNSQLKLATQIELLQSKSEQMISQIKEKDSQIKYP